MRVLSLFDGMACGMLAMQMAGIKVDRYVAYEIDNYATQTACHNFPMIEQRGDVFTADFTEFSGFDFLIGGSPCTYWSIAQANNRETEASGMGWELFSQYVRALHEAKPMFFVYENNKSMAKAIRESIDKAFGFEAVCINSALVSAQNRQRLYWVGKRNEDGTYSKVPIEQPGDLGILLKDILESGTAYREKSTALVANRGGHSLQNDLKDSRYTCAAEPVAVDLQVVGRKRNEQGEWERSWEAHTDGKSSALTSVESRRCVAEPICLNSKSGRGGVEGLQPSLQERIYSIEGKATAVTTAFMPKIAQPVFKELSDKELSYMVRETRDGRNHFDFDHYHDATKDKSSCITANTAKGVPYNVLVEPVPGYIACEWDENGKPIKAISAADGKTYTVYEVKDGQITIKGKQYPIKLADGFYIIRKLTVRECMRLQTVPEWYEFPVSDSQAYKMLGNGWTCRAIEHLLRGCMAALEQPAPEKEPKRVVVKRINKQEE